MLVLFASEADYNTNRPVRNAVIPADATTVSVTFEGLEPGSYAIKSFHDINGNGDMDTNPFGMPIEPYVRTNVWYDFNDASDVKLDQVDTYLTNRQQFPSYYRHQRLAKRITRWIGSG